MMAPSVKCADADRLAAVSRSRYADGFKDYETNARNVVVLMNTH